MLGHQRDEVPGLRVREPLRLVVISIAILLSRVVALVWICGLLLVDILCMLMEEELLRIRIDGRIIVRDVRYGMVDVLFIADTSVKAQCSNREGSVWLSRRFGF